MPGRRRRPPPPEYGRPRGPSTSPAARGTRRRRRDRPRVRLGVRQVARPREDHHDPLLHAAGAARDGVGRGAGRRRLSGRCSADVRAAARTAPPRIRPAAGRRVAGATRRPAAGRAQPDRRAADLLLPTAERLVSDPRGAEWSSAAAGRAGPVRGFARPYGFPTGSRNGVACRMARRPGRPDRPDRCGRPGQSRCSMRRGGSAGATSAARIRGLRRSRLATQVANQDSSMHMPM